MGGERAIPRHREIRRLGDLMSRYPGSPVEGFVQLARELGPIYALELPDRRRLIVVSGLEVVKEVCDDGRFDKIVAGPAREFRRVAGDGLFTAETDEPNWRKAHNILLPNFGLQAIRSYLPQMWDVVEQLLLKWQRLNPGEPVDVVSDFTRLTFDVIGICGFNYRFNSFYRDALHPLLEAVARVAYELQARQAVGRSAQEAARAELQLSDDTTLIHSIADRLVHERKAAGEAGEAVHDLLNAMLHGVDKRSGARLEDENIRYQIVTFLLAGFATTSGLLSFATSALLRNPAIAERAQREVDEVLGADLRAQPTPQQLARLVWVKQIINESLRLWPPAPQFRRRALKTELLPGGYLVHGQDVIQIQTSALHRQPEVWGDDVESFRPERFDPEVEAKRDPEAFKAFGTGQRACIGRQFAMQEATLALGKILQWFDLDDFARHELKLAHTIALKPEDFQMRVRPRRSRFAPAVHEPAATPEPQTPVTGATHGTPLLVLFGSNLGTSETLARQLADEAELRGYSTTVAALDERAAKLPVQGAVVIVAASYNGRPTDNAERFWRWLEEAPAGSLDGVKFAVFGCGHRDWAATYQAVPAQFDEQLAARGALRLAPRGSGDGAVDLDGDFRAWLSGLWPALESGLGIDAGPRPEPGRERRRKYAVEVVPEPLPNPFVESLDASVLRVAANVELQQHVGDAPLERSTRHLELVLPEGVRYSAGDHLGVLPHNALPVISRVLKRFGLASDSQIRIRALSTAHGSRLPTGGTIAVVRLLAQYVELQDVATRPQLETLLEFTREASERARLEALLEGSDAGRSRYLTELVDARRSLIDLLEELPSCELPFDLFLEMLPLLRPRFYSISSSPLVDPARCSITVGVVDAPARSGRGRYRGTCSNHLASLPVESFVYAFVRSPGAPFRPPGDPRTPMIMVGPGTGIAPFRGFLQERAVRRARGEEVGPSLLFFGCRHPDQDFLYEDELKLFEAQGITRLVCAFSRVAGQPRTYVQHRMRERSDGLWGLLERGAVVYVCGDATRMAPDVRATLATIYQERTGRSAADAERWIGELTASGRYLTDVWGG